MSYNERRPEPPRTAAVDGRKAAICPIRLEKGLAVADLPKNLEQELGL